MAEVPSVPHQYGCPVEQVHRIWTTDQGAPAWDLAEETVRFVAEPRNRQCTCVRRPKDVPEGWVRDESSGVWWPPEALGPDGRWSPQNGPSPTPTNDAQEGS